MSEFEIPSELRYTKTHEWVRRDQDGTFVIGITHHAQGLLGDLVHVELPDVETELKAGDEAGVVESVKAASDVYSPVTGEIIAVNEDLLDKPELLNTDPYGDGWLFQVQPSVEHEYDELLDSQEYEEIVHSEQH